MGTGLGLALLKLLLGLAVFVAVGYLGRFHDKRIAGVLLTFPILNGIGILAGADPLAVANSIYAVVVFNGLLLFLMIGFCAAWPRMPPATPSMVLVARLLLWTAVWSLGAPLIVIFRDRLPGAFGLLLIQIAIAAVAVQFFWKAPRGAAPIEASGGHKDLAHHLRALGSLWLTPAGLMRIGLFAGSCVLLLAAAQLLSPKWVGMISALPLPGLFAVVTLSVSETKNDFDLLRDSVLLGPLTVIAFNWLYAQAVAQLPAAPLPRAALGIGLLLLLLLLNLLLFFWLVPIISAYLDRTRQTKRLRTDVH